MADPEKKPKKFLQQLEHKLKVFRFSQRTKIQAGHQLTAEEYFAPGEQASDQVRPHLLTHSKPFKSAPTSEVPTQNQTETENFLRDHFKLARDYLVDKLERAPQVAKNATGRIFITPTLQMHDIGIREDETALKELFKSIYSREKGNDSFKLQWATGYFNLFPEFESLVMKEKEKLDIEILTASPKANGFFNGGGLKTRVPFVFRLAALQMIRKAQSMQKKEFKLFEYERPEWTFHAKGLFLTEPGQTLPSLNLIGSSNYSYRSFRRDSECNIYMFSDDVEARTEWKKEWEHMVSYSSQLAKGKTLRVSDYRNYGVQLKDKILRYTLSSFG